MKSKIMIKREALVAKISDDYNVYSTTINKTMTFPAIVLAIGNQIPDLELASYRNNILEYQWTIVLLDRLDSYDTIEEAQDSLWYLAETIPNLLGVKVIKNTPFGHVKDNKELVCIELECKSKTI